MTEKELANTTSGEAGTQVQDLLIQILQSQRQMKKLFQAQAEVQVANSMLFR